MIAPILLILVLFTAVGGVLLVRGRRGVAVDDHPLCRRCGFDLTGRPAGVDRCSECGADLAAPDAVRVGHRAPRQRLVVTGAAMTLLGLAALSLTTWTVASGTNWQSYKPVWWLARDADSPDPKTRDPALAELTARLTAGKPGDARIASLADRAPAPVPGRRRVQRVRTRRRPGGGAEPIRRARQQAQLQLGHRRLPPRLHGGQDRPRPQAQHAGRDRHHHRLRDVGRGVVLKDLPVVRLPPPATANTPPRPPATTTAAPAATTAPRRPSDPGR